MFMFCHGGVFDTLWSGTGRVNILPFLENIVYYKGTKVNRFYDKRQIDSTFVICQVDILQRHLS